MTIGPIRMDDSGGVRRIFRTLHRSRVAERAGMLAPLMHENFNRPGVREEIARHLAR